MRQTTLRLLGVLALATLWVGASALAQEREARLLSGPMTQWPIAVACTEAQDGACKNNAQNVCANLCNPNNTPNAQACVICMNTNIDRCKSACK
jgi:hypothetical protein